MKNNIFKNKSFYIASLLTLFPVFIALLFYNQIPDQVAVHFNYAFEPDGYASKVFAVFGLPLFMLLVNTIVWFALNSDPKSENINKPLKAIGLWIIPVISNIIQFCLLAYALNSSLNFVQFLPFVIGILFILIGNYLPKCKLNYTAGIRTPWSLNNPENWRKTNRLGGYLMVLGGIIIMIASFFPSIAFIVFLVVLIPMALIPFFYSYYLYKHGV